MITANFQERNLCTALSGKKNPARGPYRKKLDRSRARDKPIKFEDLGIRPAQMLEEKKKLLFLTALPLQPSQLPSNLSPAKGFSVSSNRQVRIN